VLAEATTEAQTALGLDERDPWAHLTHGVVLWRMRRHAESERAFRRALEFNPNFALAHAFLGLPLAGAGAHQEALHSAKQALRLSPKDRLCSASPRAPWQVLISQPKITRTAGLGAQGDGETPRARISSIPAHRGSGAARRYPNSGRGADHLAPAPA
jgi:tetratricopeptide (TPR) repeat protein